MELYDFTTPTAIQVVTLIKLQPLRRISSCLILPSSFLLASLRLNSWRDDAISPQIRKTYGRFFGTIFLEGSKFCKLLGINGLEGNQPPKNRKNSK
jgi:hypothetical protein